MCILHKSISFRYISSHMNRINYRHYVNICFRNDDVPERYSVERFIERDLEATEKNDNLETNDGHSDVDSISTDDSDDDDIFRLAYNFYMYVVNCVADFLASCFHFVSPDVLTLEATISWVQHLFGHIGYNKLDQYVNLNEIAAEENAQLHDNNDYHDINDDNSSDSSKNDQGYRETDKNNENDDEDVHVEKEENSEEVVVDVRNVSDSDSDNISDEDKFDVSKGFEATDHLRLQQRTGRMHPFENKGKVMNHSNISKKDTETRGAVTTASAVSIAASAPPVATVSDRFKYKSAIFDAFRHNKDEEYIEALAWMEKQKRVIPTYYVLCQMVSAEMNEGMHKCLRIKSNAISALLTIVAYLVPLSHLFTGVGIIYWFIVAEKYLIFLLVCAGIWTKQCVDGYDLNGESLTGLEDVEYNNDNDPDYKKRGFYVFVTEACEQNEGIFDMYLCMSFDAQLNLINSIN